MENHWYAHFHYAKQDSPPENYIAGHLKNQNQRLKTGNEVYRLTIRSDVARDLFFI